MLAPLPVALLAGYLGSIVAANAALDRWGLVDVGFGLEAPAGVYFAAIALTLRDLVRERIGLAGVAIAIAAGTALSYAIEPAYAIASATAFALSELADGTVYEPLRRSGLLVAVTLSGLVGLAVDSAIFVELAGFSHAAALPGLIVGKLAALAVSVALLIPLARRALPRHA